MSIENQYRVGTNGANVREEPSTTASIKTILRPGTIVTMDHMDGKDWLFVTFNGWVHKSTVKVLKSTEAIK